MPPPSWRPCPPSDAVDIGIDGSLIGAYGHDDRVCGYAALRALLDIGHAGQDRRVCAGGQGGDRLHGRDGHAVRGLRHLYGPTCAMRQGVPLRVCYENAFCLSADVTAAYDPNFAEVYEKRNAAFVN